MLRKFDTKVQHLKYKVLREIAKLEWQGNLLEELFNIKETIVPGKIPSIRCCVYKERAIVEERIKLAIGGNRNNPNIIEVIEIACDDCPVGGYEITAACRGCLAHRCEDVCKRNAIHFDNLHVAHIDKSKCVECGKCADVCPYSAIINNKRPCEQSCKVNAITMNETKAAMIDNDKCISCGACVYQCPWGAIMDKSFILNVIDLIKKSEGNKKFKTYAIVAPSISSQFIYVKPGQIIRGIKELGFYDVEEVALGADMVAYAEALELAEKGFLTSSCCPAFVDYIRKQFPNLTKHISHNLSPAATIAKHIKEKDKTAKVIFIGPCTAKKMEFQSEAVHPYIDSVITFEELQALLDGKGIDIFGLEPIPSDKSSYYGRIFAKSGGLSRAVEQGLYEHGSDFELKAITCNGIEECRTALLKASKNVLNGNFIEGMACVGGCVGGAGCLTHSEKNGLEVEKYSAEASKKLITDAVKLIN